MPPTRFPSGALASPSFLLLLVTACQPGPPIDLARVRMVDLTHALNASTIFWPTSPTRFTLDTLSNGMTPGGWFYAANTFASPEHGGTHLDAPRHFAQDQATTDQVPLQRLVAPAVVLDVTDSANANPDYLLSVADIEAFEQQHGAIPRGAIVLLRSGWSTRWPDVRRYLGDDTPGDASHLHFPSFGLEAARLLVEQRQVAALGADVASIDYGPSTDFAVHRMAGAAGVPGLENLTQLDALPPTGALVIALPIKLEGGSGGPVRVIALVPR